jgi:hypothetical protein
MLRISFLTKGGRGESLSAQGLRIRGLVEEGVGEDKKKQSAARGGEALSLLFIDRAVKRDKKKRATAGQPNDTCQRRDAKHLMSAAIRRGGFLG